MSHDHQAVFLSYASQDAEAAKRICEALRAAGVEVWFDQSELVGGDAWDAKIRKQIQSCALFVPVISASTQARGEGYFRLEWKLAVDRTHLMADDTPFLFPVVIDDTPDAAARVPDKFRDVQWTRLTVKDTPETLAARVGKLLAKAGDDVDDEASQDSAGRRRGRKRERKPAWLRYTMSLVGLAIGLIYAIKGALRPEQGDSNTPAAQPTPPALSPSNPPKEISEARQLIAKARELVNKPDLSRPAFDAADALCKRAAELDPTDAEVWAVWSHVHTWFFFLSFDSSGLRREAARESTAKAMQLDGKSFEARLAQAFYWVRGENALASSSKGMEAERLLRGLLREKPGDPQALLTLGILLLTKQPAAEGTQMLEQLAKNPAFAAVACNEIGWFQLLGEGGWEAAGAAADRSLHIQPMWPNLILKMLVTQLWQGDLQLAKATIDRLPPSALQDDVSVTNAFQLYLRRREPQQCLSLLNEVPREWLASPPYEGPKAFLAGLARLMAQQTESAERDFRRALELIEKRLAEDSNSAHLLRLKAEVLHYLNRGAEAEKIYRLVRELNPTEAAQIEAEMNLTKVDNDVRLRVLFETPDTVIDDLEAHYEQNWSMTAALLRLDPMLDPLRGHPRFAALLARAEADPHKSPAAKAVQK